MSESPTVFGLRSESPTVFGLRSESPTVFASHKLPVLCLSQVRFWGELRATAGVTKDTDGVWSPRWGWQPMASGWELGMESWRARTLLLLKQTHGPMAGEAGCVQGCGWDLDRKSVV